MKEPTANILVPRLLDKINNYSNNLKNRVKIDGIFSEFDDSANANFKKFIKLSEQRYKSVKSGTRLNNILENQKPEYNELSTLILSNKFYNNDDIEFESKKLLKKMDVKENQDLFKLRKDIISKTKDFTKSEIKNREKFFQHALKKRKSKEKDKKKLLSNKDYMYFPQYNNRNFKKSREKMPKILDKHYDKLVNKDELMEKKKYFDDLMSNDCNKLNENLMDYKSYLKDVERTHKNGDPLKLNNNKDNFGHTYNFSQDRIKLLTYKEEEVIDNRPKQKKEQKVDIIKLMRYTKRGNKKWFQRELKNKSHKKFTPFKSSKLAKTGSMFYSSTSNNFLKDSKTNSLMNTHTEDFNFNTKTQTAFSNYKNTIKTVRNEADKARYLNENFDRKMRTMEGFFKLNNLPRIDDYENIIKDKTNYIEKNERKTSNHYNRVGSKKDSDIEFDRNRFDPIKQIYSCYNRTYLNKKVLWEKEDKRRELLKKKNEEKEEEIKKYLKEIKNLDRKPNLYVDPYSNRDKNINNLIKTFNKTLTGGFYSKKRIESKLNEFNNKFEIREKEKKMHEEFMNQKLFEEEKKRREEDIEFQVFSKMKENLKNENNEQNKESENIDFNYKMVLSRGLVTNKFKIDPYKDYLEFYKITKEKEENKHKLNLKAEFIKKIQE